MTGILVAAALTAVVAFLVSAMLAGVRDTIRQTAAAGDEPNARARHSARIVGVCVILIAAVILMWVWGAVL